MPDESDGLSPAFRKIQKLMAVYAAKKARAAANENLSPKAGESADDGVPLHSEVERPDQSESAANRSASRRRGR